MHVNVPYQFPFKHNVNIIYIGLVVLAPYLLVWFLLLKILNILINYVPFSSFSMLVILRYRYSPKLDNPIREIFLLSWTTNQLATLHIAQLWWYATFLRHLHQLDTSHHPTFLLKEGGSPLRKFFDHIAIMWFEFLF